MVLKGAGFDLLEPVAEPQQVVPPPPEGTSVQDLPPAVQRGSLQLTGFWPSPSPQQ